MKEKATLNRVSARTRRKEFIDMIFLRLDDDKIGIAIDSDVFWSICHFTSLANV